MISINFKPSSKELRNFGIVMLVAFGIIGAVKFFGWPLSESVGWAYICWGISLVVGGLGISGTKAALPFYLLWMGIAFVMGNIISRILLFLFYFLMITPMAVFMKIIGRDRLILKKPQKESFWLDCRPYESKGSYQRQF